MRAEQAEALMDRWGRIHSSADRLPPELTARAGVEREDLIPVHLGHHRDPFRNDRRGDRAVQVLPPIEPDRPVWRRG